MIFSLIFILAISTTANLQGAENHEGAEKHANLTLQQLIDEPLVNYSRYTTPQAVQQALSIKNNRFYNMLYNHQLNPTVVLNHIDQHIDGHKHLLNEKKMIRLYQLQDDHGINNDDWQWCLKIKDKLTNGIKEYINTRSSYAIHEPIISDENKIILAIHLAKHKLDLNKIDIKKQLDSNHSSTAALSVRIHTCTVSGDITPVDITPVVTNAYIAVDENDNAGDIILHAQNFIEGCEHNSLAHVILKKTSKEHYDINQLIQSQSYKNLCDIEQEKVLFFPCLEDQHNCQQIIAALEARDITTCKNFQLFYIIKNLWKRRNIVENWLNSQATLFSTQ